MALITISGGQIPNYQGNVSTLKIRIYCRKTFTTSTLGVVVRGGLDSENFYLELPCTVANDTIQYPTFSIDSTDDGNPNSSSYTFAAYTDAGVPIGIIYKKLVIKATPTVTTLGAIAVYNEAPLECLPNTYYTAKQVDALLAALVNMATKMTDVIFGAGRLSYPALLQSDPIVVGHNDPLWRRIILYGVLRLSAPALVASDPIAVGQEDPLWRGIRSTYYLESYGHTSAGMAAAATAIGTAEADLLVTQLATLTTSIDWTSKPNIHIKIVGTGSGFTGASGISLTPGSMHDPGDRRVFFSDLSVKFAKGAINHFNLTWWAGKTNTTDLTVKMGDVNTSWNNSGGVTLLVGSGAWKMTKAILPSYAIIQGVGNHVDAANGTVLISESAVANDFVIGIRENSRNIAIKNLTISTGNLSNLTGLRAYDPNNTGISTIGILLEQVTFYGNGAIATNCPPQFHVGTAPQGWECVNVKLHQCQWITPNQTSAFKVDSVNTAFTFDNPHFLIGTGSIAFNLDRFGYVKVINHDIRCNSFGSWQTIPEPLGRVLAGSIAGGGTVLTLTTGSFVENDIGQVVKITGKLDSYIIGLNSTTEAIVSPAATAVATALSVAITYHTTGTLAGGHCYKVGVEIGTLVVIGGADESINKFIQVNASTANGTMTFIGCFIQGLIDIQATCILTFIGGHMYSCIATDTAGTAARIHLIGVTINPETGPVPTLLKSKFWGPRYGGSFVVQNTGYQTGEFVQTFGYNTLFYDDTAGAGLARPIVEILTPYDDGSSITAVQQVLFSIGISNLVTRTTRFTARLFRNGFNGLFQLVFSQGQPYRGLEINGIFGYMDTEGGTVTQATSRTTNVTLSTLTGLIITNNTSLAPATAASFVVTNTLIQTGDIFVICMQEGATTDTSIAFVTACGGNQVRITVRNFSAVTADILAMQIRFFVLKGKRN